MRIAILAAGAVGGYVGARLGKAGHDVALVARGDHLAAIRANGLTVRTPDGEIGFSPSVATDDPAEIGPVDAVVFAVKAHHAEAAAKQCKPLLRPGTGVVPFLNGVEAGEILATAVGAEATMLGTCYIFSRIAAPGIVQQTGASARFLFGETDGAQSKRSHALRRAFTDAGMVCPEPDDIRVELWQKFVFLASIAGMTTAARTTVGNIRDNPPMTALFVRAMKEVADVAAARGITLPPSVIDEHMAFVANAPSGARNSMAQDLDAGLPIEIEWLSGAVVRLGREAGVDTPVHQTFHAVLQPFAAGTPQGGNPK
jgi:2-dehydropantoate 2-reductase